MPRDITGSWFPSGFHGHIRSVCRPEISLEYRREARPPPPHAFLEKIKEHPEKHTFSKHDNRNSFPNSVSGFGHGMGRKKIMTASESNDLFYWPHLEKELRHQRPLTSIYKVEYWKKDDPRGFHVPQLLVPRLNRATSDFCPVSTTYRQMLRSHQPQQSFSSDNRQVPQQTTINDISHLNGRAVMLQRARSVPYKTLTVSDCLIWSRPDITKQNSSLKQEDLNITQ